jgi:hypothetical protein
LSWLEVVSLAFSGWSRDYIPAALFFFGERA